MVVSYNNSGQTLQQYKKYGHNKNKIIVISIKNIPHPLTIFLFMTRFIEKNYIKKDQNDNNWLIV